MSASSADGQGKAKASTSRGKVGRLGKLGSHQSHGENESAGGNLTSQVFTASTSVAAGSASNQVVQNANPGPATSSGSGGTNQKTAESEGARNRGIYTFKDLQNDINRMTKELQVQEAQFHFHAERTNSMGQALNENAEKISKLYKAVEATKEAQNRLEVQLNLMRQRQTDMEMFLVEMEAEIPPLGQIHSLDPSRVDLFSSMLNLDTALQQMSFDLIDLIRDINQKNSSTCRKGDPMSIILKITNEHIDSLRSIEETANKLQTELNRFRETHANLEENRRAHVRNMFK